MKTIRDEYKEYVIQHIENDLDLESVNERYSSLLTEEERNNIIWHVIRLYMPENELPQTKRTCSCGKG